MTSLRLRQDGALGADVFSMGFLLKKHAAFVGAAAMEEFDETRRAGKVNKAAFTPEKVVPMLKPCIPTIVSDSDHHRRKAAIMAVCSAPIVDGFDDAIRQHLRTRLVALGPNATINVGEFCSQWAFDLIVLLVLGRGDGQETWPGALKKLQVALAGIKGVTGQAQRDVDTFIDFIRSLTRPIREKWGAGANQKNGWTASPLLNEAQDVQCIAERIMKLVAGREREADMALAAAGREFAEGDVPEYEMWHMLFAGAAGMGGALYWAWFELTRDYQQVRDSICQEAQKKDGANEFLTSFTFEVRRLYITGPTNINAVLKCPVLNATSRAKGKNTPVSVPADWCALGALAATNRGVDWDDADRFRANRFAGQGWNFAEPWKHALKGYAYCPHGVGPQMEGFRCAGEYLVTKVLQNFVAELAANWDYKPSVAFTASQSECWSTGALPKRVAGPILPEMKSEFVLEGLRRR